MHAFIETVRAFLRLTAWKMDTPKPYGAFHIIFMLVGFTLCVFLAWKLRRVSERTNRRILLSVGGFLLISEIYKQLLYILVLFPGEYTFTVFPFQLCSIPMYFCLIIPFLKDTPCRRAMYNFLMTYNLLGGFVAFLEPSGLLNRYWMLTMHSLLWHLLIVFVGLYVGLSERGGTARSDYKSATLIFGALSLIAFGINCAFWEISDHTIKMFFVGPGNSPIIVFKDISKAFGWVASTVIYLPVVALGAFIIFSLFRLVRKRMQSRGEKALLTA